VEKFYHPKVALSTQVVTIVFMNILFMLIPKDQVDFLFSDFTVRQALEKMKKRRYSMIPIIDKQTGKYERSLMEGDFLYYLSINHLSFEELSVHRIADIPASRITKAVNCYCEIKDLYGTIVDQNFVPVVDDNGVFIGIVTRKSVMKHLLEEHPSETH
jgi:CBS domain-containing protein